MSESNTEHGNDCERILQKNNGTYEQSAQKRTGKGSQRGNPGRNAPSERNSSKSYGNYFPALPTCRVTLESRAERVCHPLVCLSPKLGTNRGLEYMWQSLLTKRLWFLFKQWKLKFSTMKRASEEHFFVAQLMFIFTTGNRFLFGKFVLKSSW